MNTVTIDPVTPDAYKLLHEGALALSQVEANGMRIDREYFQQAITEAKQTVKECRARMRDAPEYNAWRKRYGKKMNLASRQQLGVVLFDEMGFDSPGLSTSGRYKADESAIEKIDSQFVRDYLQVAKLDKARGTYLEPILKQSVGEYVHAVFNLHLVLSYRSSCDSPNFQNIPVRNPEIGKLVRRGFIASEGCQLVETDFKGAEVCVAACYHKDPTMLEYLADPTKDMHRDMAAQCYKLRANQVTKEIRHCGKNLYVFPQFYGSWYVNCARDMWDAIHMQKLEVGGRSLYEHLQSKGINELGSLDPEDNAPPTTFVGHMRQVEEHFWSKRFGVYAQWKRDFYKSYLRRGYFGMLTGFRCVGPHGRKEVTNYPVQGSSFHCLLWCLIRIQKRLNKLGMKTKLIGQIHDSIIADVPSNELDDYLQIVKHVVCVLLPKHYQWIITKIEVEAEVSPVGGSWYDKQEVTI